MPEATQFGPYLLDASEGVEGPVYYYRARRISRFGVERPCRLRLLDLSHVPDAETEASLLDEARLLVNLKHPGIVAIQDYGTMPGYMYTETELVLGVGLDELLERFGHMDQGVALVVISRLAEILAYTHKAADPDGRPLSLVHRNLAPQHVLVTPHGETKLTGFGMAQARGRLMGTTFREAYSRLGALNPEEARGEAPDYRSDLHGLGTLLYRMLTGVQPFAAGSFDQLRTAVVTGAYPSPQEHRPDLDGRLVEMLTQLLQPDPRKRPPSAWSVWKLSWQLWREIGDASDEVHLRDLVVTPAGADAVTSQTVEDR